MSVILFVRVGSELELEELQRRVDERKPSFLDVPGLIQKVYGRDPASGDWCGIYFFESQEALQQFANSDLAKSIPRHMRRRKCDAKSSRRSSHCDPESDPSTVDNISLTSKVQGLSSYHALLACRMDQIAG